MPVQTFLTQVGIAKETTWGTGISPTTADQFIPVYNPKITEIIDPILDSGYRGLASKDFALYQGFRFARYTAEFQVYPQSIGHVLMALQGGTDAVTGAGPYTHPIVQNNAALPPSYTITDYDATVATARQLTGAYLEDVTFDYAPTGMLKCQVAFVGKYTGTVTKPTAVYATDQPFLPWQNTALVNGSGNTRLITMSLTARRPWEGIWGAGGTQDLTSANVGPVEVVGKLTFKPNDATEVNLYRNNTQGQFQANFSSGTNQLILNCNLAALENPTTIDRNSPFVTVSGSIRALYNSTDGGTLKGTVVCSKSTAY